MRLEVPYIIQFAQESTLVYSTTPTWLQ